MSDQEVAKAINAKVQWLWQQRQRQPIGQYETVTGSVPIGVFGNLMGAAVPVALSVAVDTSVRAVAVASCTGFGCTEPVHEVSAGSRFPDCDHAQLTEERRLEACRWAQAHAEQCRALPQQRG